ncbi:MAG TPA: hypothetical protein VHT97_09075 [Acidimicrobiales bacterium]|jgi:hypothetical protein|nr:hypothetical protein [Acidimicrobiales bacterium]
MAAVSVFVDDAILGRLPSVCIRSGQPADMTVRSTRAVGNGGLGLFWLLFVLGPPGWVALLVFACLLPGEEQLTVLVPYARSVWDGERQRRRAGMATVAAGFAALALALFVGPFPLIWVVIGTGLITTGLGVLTVVWRRDVGILLDASRRWVTLTGVHPDFARAAERGEAGVVRP